MNRFFSRSPNSWCAVLTDMLRRTTPLCIQRSPLRGGLSAPLTVVWQMSFAPQLSRLKVIEETSQCYLTTMLNCPLSLHPDHWLSVALDYVTHPPKKRRGLRLFLLVLLSVLWNVLEIVLDKGSLSDSLFTVLSIIHLGKNKLANCLSSKGECSKAFVWDFAVGPLGATRRPTG